MSGADLDDGLLCMVCEREPDDTCRHLSKTEADFVREVAEMIADLDNGTL